MSTIADAFGQGRADRENYIRPERKPVLVTLARWAGRHAPNWRRVRSGVNQTVAFAAIDVAVWHGWGMTAGLITAGLSLLVLDALASEGRNRR